MVLGLFAETKEPRRAGRNHANLPSCSHSSEFFVEIQRTLLSKAEPMINNTTHMLTINLFNFNIQQIS